MTKEIENRSEVSLIAKAKEMGVLSSYKLESSIGSNDFPLSSDVESIGKDRIEIQLRKYTSHYERYNFYMEISLKAIVFYYVVTGAVLGFYLANSAKPYMKISLLLPMILGVVWGVIFLCGAYLWLKARCGILNLERDLIDKKLIVPPPDFHLLLWLLIVFGMLFFLDAGSMILVWRLV